MFDNAQPVAENEPHWLDDVDFPAADEWGRDSLDRRCRCLRCGHDWETRLPFGQWPNACPDCKSPRWFKPPKQKGRTPVVLGITPEQMSDALSKDQDALERLFAASPKQLERELLHPTRQCLRCPHRWQQRGDPKHLPKACPRCRSPRWYVPRQENT